MRQSRKKYVVDTNVPKVANLAMNPAAESEFPKDCQMKCLESIVQVIKEGCVVIDNGGEVLCEYGRNLSRSGEPGIGDRFMRLVSHGQGDPSKVCSVPLTPKNSSYHEFPRSPEFAGFDNDDHKFIALANACNKTPVILQATDSEWWKYKKAFRQAGITVCFLCPGFVKKTHDRKHPENSNP